MSISKKQHDDWMAHLHDALESVQDAIKKLDQDDLEEMDGYLIDASQTLSRVSTGVEEFRWAADPEFQEKYARDWFREASTMEALLRALPTETLFEEGAYRWRVRDRDTVTPPLVMPREYERNCHGPLGEVTVGCNTQFVTFEIRIAHSGMQR